MFDEEKYNERIELLAERYNDRSLAVLNRMKEELVCEGYDCEGPFDMHGDDYRWYLLAQRPGTTDEENRCELTIIIAEQFNYEGHGRGLTFRFDAVEWGGAILGECCPYNYTPDVWVDSFDDESVEARWRLMEELDVSGLAELLCR